MKEVCGREDGEDEVVDARRLRSRCGRRDFSHKTTEVWLSYGDLVNPFVHLNQPLFHVTQTNCREFPISTNLLGTCFLLSDSQIQIHTRCDFYNSSFQHSFLSTTYLFK